MDQRVGQPELPCRVRVAEPCRLCLPGATGPEDCGLVYLVMTDPDLRAELARMCADAGVPCSLRAKASFPRNT